MSPSDVAVTDPGSHGVVMREADGRKLDHKTLEALRIRAVNQVEDEMRPETVAGAIGMNSATV